MEEGKNAENHDFHFAFYEFSVHEHSVIHHASRAQLLFGGKKRLSGSVKKTPQLLIIEGKTFFVRLKDFKSFFRERKLSLTSPLSDFIISIVYNELAR